jgi:hypothetical protein
VGIVIKMFGTVFMGTRWMLVVPVFLSSFPLGNAQAPTAQPAQTPQTADKTAAPAAKSPTSPSRYRYQAMPKGARNYYALIWGVDSLALKSVESGEIIRFSYRIVDANKAKMLNDKKNEPSLIDPQAGVSLVVPSLEKVGQLRQSSTPETGKAYWMAFSNKGRYVKPGHRVNVVIGNFHADGLVVQ